MSGKESEMTPLAARKKLLLMESEINREKFLEGIRDVKTAVHRTKEHFTKLGSFASLAGKVAGTVPRIRDIFAKHNNSSADPGSKRKLPFLVNAAVTGTSLWFLLRSLRRKI